MIVYMFSQALALALRFSMLHAAVEKLSTTLENRNQALSEEVAERTRLQHEIVSVSEEERRRMSHALHDGLCQQLTGARLQCAGLAAIADKDAAAAPELARLSALLEQAVDHAYDLAHGLWPMPPESDDALTALGALVRRRRAACAIAIELQTFGGCAACRTPHAAHLVGIAREALGNAVKHAGATHITVTLDCSDARAVTLCIADDGQEKPANSPGKGGLGKRIMAYRAQLAGGELRVETGAAGGTRVITTLPCQPADPAQR
jgi:signal transduction histidine kinase